MSQPGFFDLQYRYEDVDAHGDPLVAINAAMPFELFRVKLKTALIKGGLRRSEVERKSPAGRKPWARRWKISFATGYRSCGLRLRSGEPSSGWGLRTRCPTPRRCGSIASRWRRQARWRNCSTCLTATSRPRARLHWIGDVRLAQGDLAGADAAYSESLAIRRKLAAADLGKTEAQRDLCVSLSKLADRPGSGINRRDVVTQMKAMDTKGMLAPADRSDLDEARAKAARE